MVCRLRKVVHDDGSGRAAGSDPATLQFSDPAHRTGAEGGRELHRGGVLHGDLQREGARPSGSQRVSLTAETLSAGHLPQTLQKQSC